MQHVDRHGHAAGAAQARLVRDAGLRAGIETGAQRTARIRSTLRRLAALVFRRIGETSQATLIRCRGLVGSVEAQGQVCSSGWRSASPVLAVEIHANGTQSASSLTGRTIGLVAALNHRIPHRTTRHAKVGGDRGVQAGTGAGIQIVAGIADLGSAGHARLAATGCVANGHFAGGVIRPGTAQAALPVDDRFGTLIAIGEDLVRRAGSQINGSEGLVIFAIGRAHVHVRNLAGAAGDHRAGDVRRSLAHRSVRRWLLHHATETQVMTVIGGPGRTSHRRGSLAGICFEATPAHHTELSGVGPSGVFRRCSVVVGF